ncbi:MAG: hypothetical protein Q8933_21530 [Bacteroidota bacterium]|nr:hypothetical protein [Bacteroidota bacterium]MDP4197275.1 hypothetical protein [Bacteroidota bacterium]
MNKKILFFSGTLLSFFLNGCLVGHKISYEIVSDKSGKGTARVTYTDIRSDAQNDREFDEDKKNLFDYMQKSSRFLSDMKKEGKNIVSRELHVENGKLNGTAVYRFDKISDVENLTYDDGFYFITLALDDSVIATNGEIIKSDKYKRILWSDNVDTLKFQILTEPAENTPLKDLVSQFRK